MKCVNCDKTALFEYKLTQKKSVFYCNADLPKFLDERKRAGLLTITQEYKDASKSALETVAFEPTAPEEPVVVKPKKKTTKKSTE